MKESESSTNTQSESPIASEEAQTEKTPGKTISEETSDETQTENTTEKTSENPMEEPSLDEQLADLIPDAQVDPDIKDLLKEIGEHLVRTKKAGICCKLNFLVQEMNNFLENKTTKKAVEILKGKGYYVKTLYWCSHCESQNSSLWCNLSGRCRELVFGRKCDKIILIGWN